MRAILFFILSIFFFTAVVSGQKELTKEEILKYWIERKSENLKGKDVLQVIGGDSILNSQTLKLIDSLHQLGIDSIIIYTVAYPGYIGSDKSNRFVSNKFICYLENH